MILQENTNRFKTNIADKPSEFQIKASAKAFRILSNNLYTNKIRAVVRELSTNAHDAHIFVNKKNVPFSVHLPTSMEPWFEVKDYGPGLSEEDIHGIYTTYFDSDKIHSNDYVGALGLGSKSPFSYTDSFTVTSKFNGKKSIYSCFLNESNVPSIMKISDEEMEDNESTGMTITVRVQKTDISFFREEAEKVYRPFNPKPEILNVEIEIQSYPPKILFEGKNMIVRESKNRYYLSGNNQITIIYGCVEYPLEIENIISDRNILGFLKSVRYSNVYITIPLGNLEIAPSREALSLDKKTISYIANIIEKEIEYIKKDFLERIKDAESDWERVKIMATIPDTVMKFLFDESQRKRIVELYDNKKAYAVLNINYLSEMRSFFDLQKEEKLTEHLFKGEVEIWTPIFKRERAKIYYSPILSNPLRYFLQEEKKIHFYYKDVEETKTVSNFRRFVRKHEGEIFIVFNNSEDIKVFGRTEYKKVTTVEYIKSEIADRTNYNGLEIATGSSKDMSNFNYLEVEDVCEKKDKEVVFLYVIKGRGNSYHSGGHEYLMNNRVYSVFHYMDRFISHLVKKGRLSAKKEYIPVIIKKYLANQSRFKKDDRFIPFNKILTLVDYSLKNYYRSTKAMDMYWGYNLFNFVSGSFDKTSKIFFEQLIKKERIKKSKITDIIIAALREFEEKGERTEELKKEQEIYNSFIEFRQSDIRKEIQEEPIISDIKTLLDTLQEDYPMLSFVDERRNRRCNDKDIDKVADYILSMDYIKESKKINFKGEEK